MTIGLNTARPAPVKKFWPMRDLPSYLWLVLTVIVSVGHRWLPEPRWLMIHLVLLGSVSHAILVWSQHFSYALLHVPASERDLKAQNLRLIGFNAGVVVVVVGILSSLWQITLVGACLVVAAVVWHAASLLGRFRRAIGVRFAVSLWYYIAASAALPIGATLGVLLAHGFSDPAHGQMKVSHALINVLGWVGLTVLGTLVTLWPTMLRTKMRPEIVLASRRALWVFVAALSVTALGAGFGVLLAVVVGLVFYLAGVVWLGVVFARTAAQRPPVAFCTLSVGAAYLWLVGCLVVLVVGFTRGAAAGSWTLAYSSFTTIAPFLVAGFAVQVLIGALSYLIPVIVSQGPASSRAANTEMDRGGVFRIVMANLALLLAAFPVPSVVLVVATMLYLGATASFLVLMIRSLRAARSAAPSASTRLADAEARAAGISAKGPQNPYGEKKRGWLGAQAVAAVVASTLAIALAVAVNPSALGVLALGNAGAGTQQGSTAGSGNNGSLTADQIANAPKQTVEIEARDMKFFPASIDVEAGTNLTIVLTNTDKTNIHDLVFPGGETSGRLAPGDSATIELGVLNSSLGGWCSILGHKQMGMVFDINVTGSGADNSDPANHQAGGDDAGSQAESSGSMDHSMHGGDQAAPSAADDLNFMASAPEDFVARDALLEPLAADNGPVTHKMTFEITEEVREIAPGVTQEIWMFNKQFPGPSLHGRVGDTFEITLVNHGSMGHSIDFHASEVAPDGPMRTIAPGESLVYTFTAKRAGIWMYHCGTMPMTAHIANGMAGAVVIEPDDLPEVDKSYLLVQSEMYLGAQGQPVDVEKALSGEHNLDVVLFNGYANQYVDRPLTATVGERVRVWVLDVGPSRASSFHVVGGQFDRVWFEGAYTLGSAKAPADGAQGGAQALALQAAQGGFVELTFGEAGNYPFITHIMVDAERGAKGIFSISD